MKTYYAVALSMLAGVALGGAAIQGLHAQTKSSKAYTVTELETLDARTAADVAARIQKMQEGAGGHNFRTGGGKVTAMEGSPPPQRVAITEWDNLEKAQAFFKSKAWTDIGPERDKALKTRPYADMRWKLGTNEFYRDRAIIKLEAVSLAASPPNELAFSPATSRMYSVPVGSASQAPVRQAC